MKKLYILFFIAICAFTAFSRGKVDFNETNKTSVPKEMRIAALAGPSGMGMAYLFENNPTISEQTEVTFEIASSVDVLLPKLINGDVDIGILPPNVAAKLYNVNPQSIVAGAIVGNGMVTLVTRDSSISSLADLAGKTITVAGQGATPEFVFRTLLAKTEIPATDVTLDFSLPYPEIASALISDKISYALVPEPFATVAVLNGSSGDKPVKRVLSLQNEWKNAGLGDSFPMTLCVINKDYAQAHPEAVRIFLEAYEKSIEWTVTNPQDAGVLVEKYSLGLKAPIAAKSIPQAQYVFISAINGKAAIENLLSVFLEFAPVAIGGKLPDEGFYFK